MNRLKDQVSPYLVQHAANPVHWWPWGEEAFLEARRSGRPVLLSVGYSACHWCHVMAHESFEDAATAEVMNRLFVNIKVDREERPDVDHVYMSALHTLGRQGGWPLTMFLDADGRPFWGGTYFPKDARYGQPAFVSVLHTVANAFDTRAGDVDNNARAILDALKSAPAAAAAALALDLALLDAIAVKIAPLFDSRHGGLKGAPKFPNPGILETLWRAADRTGNESSRAPTLTTLRQMALGGIHDHIGGGFARYSVDERWLVPHFEKMLYDNAQLLPLLALAAHGSDVDLSDAELLRAAAHGVVDWLIRDMIGPDGGFCASEDADSLTPDGHMEEGAFYTWTPAETDAALGAEATAFSAAYDITKAGNFEGRSIPNRLAGGPAAHPEAFAPQRAALRKARDNRPRPGRDDKILADWNGLAIAGLARAGALLGHPGWIEEARKVYDSVRRLLGDGPGLAHAYRDGHMVRPGFAADHAAMALAALALAENGSPDGALVEDATRWCRILLDRYATESGVLAMTAPGTADLPLRPAPTHDDAAPNANGMAAEAFIRLFALTGDPDWLEAADRLIAALTPAVLVNPFGHASALNALDLRLRRVDIALEGGDEGLRGVALAVPYPNRTLRSNPSARDAQATVCVDGRCSLPIRDPAALSDRIRIDLRAGPPAS